MPFHAPKSLTEAFAALDQPGIAVIGGGTDWFAQAGDRLAGRPLLDVRGLPGFRGISWQGGRCRLGAATRWADVARADLPPAFDALRAAAREVGSIQIQNAGTIAGNLCNASPAADGVPPLLVLDAEVELVSRAGVRVLPLERFILGPRRTALRPGELVSAVLVPDVAGRSGFLKIGARRYLVISIAMVAGLVRVEAGRLAELRLAVGSCSPVARRLATLEARLAGWDVSRPLPQVTPDLLPELSPIADVRASAEYRLEAVAEAVQRLLTRLVAEEGMR